MVESGFKTWFICPMSWSSYSFYHNICLERLPLLPNSSPSHLSYFRWSLSTRLRLLSFSLCCWVFQVFKGKVVIVKSLPNSNGVNIVPFGVRNEVHAHHQLRFLSRGMRLMEIINSFFLKKTNTYWEIIHIAFSAPI